MPKHHAHKHLPRARREKRAFLRVMLTSPLGVGAIFPSGTSLARCMAGAVDLSRPGAVVELGAGTGVVTRSLLARGIPPERLVVIEREPRFHRFLVEHFPAVRVLKGDARELGALLQEHGITQVGNVVSSLPLLAMPLRDRAAIFEGVFSVLGGKGELIQFSYGLVPPAPGRPNLPYALKTARLKRVWRNIPPATVWRYQAQQH